MGSRGDLHHLLVPPLDGAVSLVQMQNVPVLVPCRGRSTLLQAWQSHTSRWPISARSSAGQPGENRPPEAVGPALHGGETPPRPKGQACWFLPQLRPRNTPLTQDLHLDVAWLLDKLLHKQRPVPEGSQGL